MALALVLVLAGCGGGDSDTVSQDEYQQQLDQTATDLTDRSAELFDDLGAVVTGDESAGDAAADAVGQIADQLRESASELDSVDPPDNAEEANDDLVGGLRAYADDLEEIQGSLEDGDLAEAQSALEQMDELDSVQELEQAAEQLREAGYTFET